MTFHMRDLAPCLLLAATLGHAAGALAQSAHADCTAIENDHDRLACYDRASGRPPSAKPAEAPAVPAPAASHGQQPAEDPLAYIPALAPHTAKSIIDSNWGFEPTSQRYLIDLYHPNYLLIGRYTDHVNNQPFTPLFQALGEPPQNLDNTEAKFQLSFKMRLWATDDRRWGVWAAYTQQNQWQVYNGDVSRPFRETNYMPELFVSFRPNVEFAGFHWRLLNAGYNHQSNGRADPLSRSWDRLYAEVGVERENLVLSAKAWYRIKEEADKDDNPDITSYMGYSEFNALYRLREHSFAGMARGYIGTGGKGAYQLTYTSPRLLGPLRGYVQLFSGYGESMIDYNWKQTTIGAGIALNDGY